MTQLSRGQRANLAALGCSGPFEVDVTLAGPGMTVDLACFGLDAAGRLSDDRYLVFYNSLSTPEGAIALRPGGAGAVFRIDLARLPAHVARLVFTAAIDGAGCMRQLGESALRVGGAVYRFGGADFDQEKAIKVAEIYRHDGGWRLAAVGQGFAGGLAALLADFGGTEAAPSTPSPAPPPAPVVLTKPGEQHRISLAKGGAAPALVTVKATWRDNGDGRADNDDLDLRAGLLLPDGRMKFIAAPECAGSVDGAPWVRHQGDVTSATAKAPATETIVVHRDIAERLGGRVALVFSVYSAVTNGKVSIASLQPRMRMEYGDQVVECELDPSASRAARSSSVYTYVIGTAVFERDSVLLAPGGQTSSPGSEHTPWLRWRGDGFELTMDGPAVFKGVQGAGMMARSKYRYS